MLGEIADEVGLPPGVLNVVTGDVAASEHLTTHPGVDMVSFTGSDAVGQADHGPGRQGSEEGAARAGRQVAEHRVRRLRPRQVRGSAPRTGSPSTPARAARCRRASSPSARSTTRSSRRWSRALGRIKVGDPTNPKTGMGPLIREAQRERVERYVATGTAEGARLACGGGRPAGLDRGLLLRADAVRRRRQLDDRRAGRDLRPGRRRDPVRRRGRRGAHRQRHPLRARGVGSGTPTRCARSRSRSAIQAGTVSINGGGGGPHLWGPFGGYKQSGIGREFGDYGLLEYTQLKTVTWSAGRP